MADEGRILATVICERRATMSAGRRRRRLPHGTMLLAVGAALTQGAAVVAGYMTGFEWRSIALMFVVWLAFIAAVTSSEFECIKKI